ncbi:MAG: ATP-dependent protease subunit HslV [Clostridia bacterium]
MKMEGTTICAVRKNGVTAIAGDGQVTMGESVILKGSAKKVKRIYNGNVIMGFAGSVADAMALSEKFEKMLQKYSGNLMRSAVELAELWRSDKFRKLEAMMIVADKECMLLVSGSGEVIDPDGDVCAIGSGGNYALAAARALVKETTNLTAKEIAFKSLTIASELCVFTNDHIIVEEV